MPNSADTTTLSTKGQIVLPKAVRERRNWAAGTRLVVEETPEGVLLKPAPLFPRTTLDEVVGSLKYDGPTRTIEEMNAAVLAEAKRRHARGRY
jgi:AbrB family looped-hinge helix DNA binding protein